MVTEIRPEIMAFAEAMEKQMQYNESRGKGYAWAVAKPWFLYSRLEDEFTELGNELVMEPDFNEHQVQHESMDVSCVAFFIWCQSVIREVNKCP